MESTVENNSMKKSVVFNLSASLSDSIDDEEDFTVQSILGEELEFKNSNTESLNENSEEITEYDIDLNSKNNQVEIDNVQELECENNEDNIVDDKKLECDVNDNQNEEILSHLVIDKNFIDKEIETDVIVTEEKSILTENESNDLLLLEKLKELKIYSVDELTRLYELSLNLEKTEEVDETDETDEINLLIDDKLKSTEIKVGINIEKDVEEKWTNNKKKFLLKNRLLLKKF